MAAARARLAMQVRLATPIASEAYVAEKLWRFATLAHCPWHPLGGCGFTRHGTYPRVRPRGTLIARWYCPKARRTVSALPDCLASHYSGTLADFEAMVMACELAPSRAAAGAQLRTDIELPGALRYLDRLTLSVRGALVAIRGLQPEHFGAVEPTLSGFASALGQTPVLSPLRHELARHLPHLPTPFGFMARRHTAGTAAQRRQHKMGTDPPQAFVHPRS